MDFQDLGIKEVNAYYARRGGIRTAAVNGYANVGSFSGLMQRAAAQAGRAAQAAAERDSQDAGARSTVPRHRPMRRRRPERLSGQKRRRQISLPKTMPPPRPSPATATSAATNARP